MSTELSKINVKVGDIIHFVDEVAGDYNDHVHLPALVQHVYVAGYEKGRVHLQVFEAYPEDNRAVDAEYSDEHKPGTWHIIEEQHG